MLKALVLGTVLGGLALFAWSAISWMVLPLHDKVMTVFTNDDAVTQAIVANAPRSGVYILPGGPPNHDSLSPEQRKAADQSVQDRMMKGPMVFASVRIGPLGSMAALMIKGLLIQMLAALLVSALVWNTRPMSFAGRLLNWNWWSFSVPYTAAQFLDLIVGWLLAGCIVAKVVNRETTPPLRERLAAHTHWLQPSRPR
jgi:hypothetical protein